jgi:hypothetical protein
MLALHRVLIVASIVSIARVESTSDTLAAIVPGNPGGHSDRQNMVDIMRTHFMAASDPHKLLEASIKAWEQLTVSAKAPWLPARLFGARGNCWYELKHDMEVNYTICNKVFEDINYLVDMAYRMAKCHDKEPMQAQDKKKAVDCSKADNRYMCYLTSMVNGHTAMFMSFVQMIPLMCNHLMFRNLTETCSSAAESISHCDDLKYKVRRGEASLLSCQKLLANEQSRFTQCQGNLNVALESIGNLGDVVDTKHALLQARHELTASAEALTKAQQEQERCKRDRAELKSVRDMNTMLVMDLTISKVQLQHKTELIRAVNNSTEHLKACEYNRVQLLHKTDIADVICRLYMKAYINVTRVDGRGSLLGLAFTSAAVLFVFPLARRVVSFSLVGTVLSLFGWDFNTALQQGITITGVMTCVRDRLNWLGGNLYDECNDNDIVNKWEVLAARMHTLMVAAVIAVATAAMLAVVKTPAAGHRRELARRRRS